MKLIFFTFLLISLNLYAETSLKKTGLEKMIQPKVSLESSTLSDTSLSGYDGSLEVAKNKVSINNAIVGFTYTNWAFDWNNVDALPFGDGVNSPIEEMHSFKINANIPYFASKNLFILTSLSAKSTFEKEVSNSYGAGLFSFASLKLDKNHAIQFGAFANYHPVSTLALPVISYSYRARQNDGFKFILGFPRTYVGYHANKNTLIRFGVIFSQSLIRLSNSSAIEESGFIEAEDYMSNLGVSYELNKYINLETDLLYGIKRDITIYSKNGDQLNSYSIEPSLGASLKITILF
jgi:hypothetical protein